MNRLVFFAASKDQRKYFTRLEEAMPNNLTVWWYKKWNLPSFCLNLPFNQIKQQIDLLQKRKQNSASGQKKVKPYWRFFRAIKWLESIWLFYRYLGFLKTVSAEYVGIWNGKKYRQAILVIAAEFVNKKRVFFERGPLPGYSCLDPRGVNFNSSLPRKADFYMGYSCPEQNVMGLNSGTYINSLPNNYIFVPFQVVEDSNVYLHSPWIKHMRDFYQQIEKLSINNPQLKFIIKEHPACPESYEDLREKAKQTNGKIQFIDEIDSTQLVSNADAVLTINSTVGMEAIMARKKLIVVGEALYNLKGLVKIATNESELMEIVKQLDNWKVDTKLINQYLCFIKNEYAVPGDAIYSFSDEHLQVMLKKLELILQGKADLAMGIQGT